MEIEQSNGKAIIKAEGELVIWQAEQFQSALTRAMQDSGAVVIDLTQVDRIDLSILQLLYSAGLTAAGNGKELVVHEPESAYYRDLLETAGFG